MLGTGESIRVWSPSSSSSGDEVDGERTHWIDSRRLDLAVYGVSRLRNSFVGDMEEIDLRDGVDDETSVPLRLARAFGSMLLRRRWPPRGTLEVSTANGDSSNHLFSRSQLQ